MGYLPSFRPTEIFTTATNKKVFGVNSDEFSNFNVGSVDNILKSATTATPSVDGGVLANPNAPAGRAATSSGTQVGAANIETNTSEADVFCPRIFRPVCAQGVTYGNDCEATAAGKTVFTAGACQNGAGNGTGGATGGGEGNNNRIGIDPETGCMIAGFDEFGEPIFWGRDGSTTDSPQNCLKDSTGDSPIAGTNPVYSPDAKKPLFNMEDIKANWHYLAVTALAVLLLTKK